MRIDPSNLAASQLSSDLSSQQVGTKAGVPSSARSSSVSEDDRTTLSSDTTSVASLVGTALKSPELRQGRVDNLRQAISNGEYRVSPESVAAAMVGESS
ncbi:MAG: flagellar biosynthesis anti-sigma factor FlgM [Acidobacteriota bacterium]|nr:flagellar biosynthesis anti-sigma factor FlgM [Acidobacteriota bacterium]